MKRGGRLPVLAPWLLLPALLWAGPAWSGTDNMELGVNYNWTWPQMDAAHMQPGRSFGLLFHYWLNDTTAIDAAVDQFDNVWKVSEPHGSSDVDFKMYLLSAGARYSPEVDFFLSPYFGGGLAYELWNTTSSALGAKDHKGSGLALYLTGGAEYRISPRVAIGPSLRFVYAPFKDRLEERVLVSGGKRFVDKTPLTQVGFFVTGLNFTVQIR